MASKRIDRTALAEVIRNLDGISNDQRADLLQLLNDQKRYGLVWEEHTENAEEKLREQLPVLKEVEERRILSDDAESPNHILIEGDNLHALTALTYTHEGKVDVIYIDPPYNTGNKDFIYNDSFVDAEDGYRHSKWLSFMSKRLRIAKKLLSERGVIFISIDDNEQANLKLLCDEVFGERNFIAILHVEMSTTQGMKVKAAKSGSIVKNTEYILVYSNNGRKNIASKILYDFRPEYDDHYSIFLTDNDEKKSLKEVYHEYNPDANISKKLSLLYSEDYIFREFVENNRKSIYADDKITGIDVNDFEIDKIYRVEKNDRTYIVINNGTKMRQLLCLDDSFGCCDDFNKSFGLRKIRGDWWKDFYKDMGNVTKEGDVEYSNGKKPVRLIQQIIEMSSKRDSIVLDFFAGSGTTLHSLINANIKDSGKRQCILVQGIERNVNIATEKTLKRCENVILGLSEKGFKNNNLRYYKVDFVERDSSMTAKKKLMEASTELLCIKQDLYAEKQTFGSIKLNPRYARYFDDGKKQMLIIYNTDAIESLVGEIEKMSADINIMTYVFSTNNYALDADFEDVADKVTLCALPAAIYNAYLNVLPKKANPKTEEDETETIPGE